MMKFSLNKVEEERYKKWLEEHRQHCSATLDGRDYPSVSFEFSPTGIGDKIKIKCECGRFIDVTDLESW